MSSLVEVLENNDLMEKILINLRDQRWKNVMCDFIKKKESVTKGWKNNHCKVCSWTKSSRLTCDCCNTYRLWNRMVYRHTRKDSKKKLIDFKTNYYIFGFKLSYMEEYKQYSMYRPRGQCIPLNYLSSVILSAFCYSNYIHDEYVKTHNYKSKTPMIKMKNHIGRFLIEIEDSIYPEFKKFSLESLLNHYLSIKV